MFQGGCRNRCSRSEPVLCRENFAACIQGAAGVYQSAKRSFVVKRTKCGQNPLCLRWVWGVGGILGSLYWKHPYLQSPLGMKWSICRSTLPAGFQSHVTFCMLLEADSRPNRWAKNLR